VNLVSRTPGTIRLSVVGEIFWETSLTEQYAGRSCGVCAKPCMWSEKTLLCRCWLRTRTWMPSTVPAVFTINGSMAYELTSWKFPCGYGCRPTMTPPRLRRSGAELFARLNGSVRRRCRVLN